MTATPQSPITQDLAGFILNNEAKGTLFMSTSEAQEYTPEFNLVVNTLNYYYNCLQHWSTFETLPKETTFEHQDAEEYHTLIEKVIDKFLDRTDKDGIIRDVFWSDAADGKESVCIWFRRTRENEAKMFQLICTDEQYIKEAAEAHYLDKLPEAELRKYQNL